MFWLRMVSGNVSHPPWLTGLLTVFIAIEYAQVSAGKSLSFITLLDFIEQAEIADDADEEEQKQFDQICKCFVKAIVDVSLAGKFCQKMISLFFRKQIRIHCVSRFSHVRR
jgi:hypothetical protein